MTLVPFYLTAGLLSGALNFGGLWWNTRLIAAGRHPLGAIVLMAGRFLALAGMLTLASLHGAAPLLITLAGLTITRGAVMCRVQRSTR